MLPKSPWLDTQFQPIDRGAVGRSPMFAGCDAAEGREQHEWEHVNHKHQHSYARLTYNRSQHAMAVENLTILSDVFPMPFRCPGSSRGVKLRCI